jgi:Tol biopolymer transport system component
VWSPDGRTIAAAATLGPNAAEMVILDLATLTTRELAFAGDMRAGVVEWLDDRALLINATESQGSPPQLWRMSVADGHLSRLTNDLTNYVGLSLTADRHSLTTVLAERHQDVWVGDASARTGTNVITSELRGLGSVTWVDDRLLYDSERNGGATLRRVGVDGGAAEDFIPGRWPISTRDGHTVVFANKGLWKADADGRHVVKLLEDEVRPMAFTPDERSVIFLTSVSGLQSVSVVSLDGGKPAPFLNFWVANNGLDVSRDGKALVVSTRDATGGAELVVCDYPTCANRRSLPDAGVRSRFMPDGRGVACACGGGNIKVFPLDGRPAYQLTHFADGESIRDFAWSADGSRLAVTRRTSTNDIVLFKRLGG